MTVTVSATLAVNEALNDKRRQGVRVLPLGFGEAGLPVHPVMRDRLSAGNGANAYGPVAGSAALREAAAGYWERRGLPTDPGMVIAGPGSKPLLYSLLLEIGGDTAIAAPSWVSYAAQSRLVGQRPIMVPTATGQGGVPQPDLLHAAVTDAREQGRTVNAVVVTVPDNPTGTVASAETVRRLAEVARELDLVIISDEIYRDLVHLGPEGEDRVVVHSPAEYAPERTVISSGLSKNLALGGWRIGVLRLPDSEIGHRLRGGLLGVASEIWSSPAAPVQEAASYAFTEPDELVDHIDRSRRLHGIVARAVTDVFTRAGATVAAPTAAFYLYPDFEPLRERLAELHGVTTGPGLTGLLLERYGMGVLPAVEFGESTDALRMRVATSLLYGESEERRYAALSARDPLALPWVRAHLTRLSEVLDSVLSESPKHASTVIPVRREVARA
ncbi:MULTISPECIES: pyridoxal phosphate-dependent aminotransferase [Nocardiopsis]|uniref:Aminotransferase n=2 Tax=Nocardiopsis alba TaxID=53437 RepID=A0A7K2IW71_9ACTN|nr:MULTISPECIES: pyridoxal phosphate-dependent aminotransferase [Nocardiopsis]AFR09206.1 aminotransferase class I and II family protein [Nocardiopsis alba ATCC BAA-2165]MEC3894425.1 pyridoxal phosphate-dependent aminotransferase [Nocardiopsis sp. LDBS1602]MYR34193.1 aminotransferase class I/II-fold pyridoxal phosphate-dependent enzyme [Nocardiopsis alba]